jgi:acetyl esterase/lipase
MRGSEPDPELRERRSLVDAGTLAAAEAGVDLVWSFLNGVPVLRCLPHDRSDDGRIILWFHGGGYRLGTAGGFQRWTSGLAAACGCEVVSVDYRLAPEHPYPEALLDAVLAYAAVLGPTRRVVVGGESAGGGLAAALMLAAADRGLQGPAGAVLCSPWLDLRNRADSFDTNAAKDDLFPRDAAEAAAALYLAGHSTEDPYASPLLGDWRALMTPILVQASDAENLRDDAMTMSTVAPSVRLELFDGVPHAWHIGYPDAARSVEAVEKICRFVDEIAPRSTSE